MFRPKAHRSENSSLATASTQFPSAPTSDDLEFRIQTNAVAISKKQEELEKLHKDVESLERTITALTAEMHDKKDSIQQIMQDNPGLEERDLLSSLQMSICYINDSITDISPRLNRLQGQKEGLLAQVNVLEKRKDELISEKSSRLSTPATIPELVSEEDSTPSTKLM